MSEKYIPSPHPDMIEKERKAEKDLNDEEFIKSIFTKLDITANVSTNRSEITVTLDRYLEYEEMFQVSLALQRRDIFFYGGLTERTKTFWLSTKELMEGSSRYGAL